MASPLQTRDNNNTQKSQIRVIEPCQIWSKSHLESWQQQIYWVCKVQTTQYFNTEHQLNILSLLTFPGFHAEVMSKCTTGYVTVTSLLAHFCPYPTAVQLDVVRDARALKPSTRKGSQTLIQYRVITDYSVQSNISIICFGHLMTLTLTVTSCTPDLRKRKKGASLCSENVVSKS